MTRRTRPCLRGETKKPRQKPGLFMAHTGLEDSRISEGIRRDFKSAARGAALDRKDDADRLADAIRVISDQHSKMT